MKPKRYPIIGPTVAGEIRSGEPRELSYGHVIECAPTGGSGSEPNRLGASVVGWDPLVKEAGVDTGYSPRPDMLRAPDVAVGNVPNKPGWVEGVPELAIEYADIGQDEEKLQTKIVDLLDAGTKHLWVVRLAGPRRVEIFERGKRVRTALPGETIAAPGVLKNAVRVEALYDRDEAERATLRNLLQRQGYEDLDDVLQKGIEQGVEKGIERGRAEGEAAGLATAVIAVLEAREIRVTKAARERVARSTDVAELALWVRRAAVVQKAAELFE